MITINLPSKKQIKFPSELSEITINDFEMMSKKLIDSKITDVDKVIDILISYNNKVTVEEIEEGDAKDLLKLFKYYTELFVKFSEQKKMKKCIKVKGYNFDTPYNSGKFVITTGQLRAIMRLAKDNPENQNLEIAMILFKEKQPMDETVKRDVLSAITADVFAPYILEAQKYFKGDESTDK